MTTTATFAPARPNRRGTELFLLLFAVIVSTAALSAVVLAHDNRITGKVGLLSGGFLAVYLIAHIAVRKLAPAADPLLLPIMALLNGLGLAMIYRLDLGYADRARRLGKPIPSGRAELQLTYSFVAVLVLIAVLVIIRDHRTLARYTYTSAFIGLGLLATLVFAPSQNGAADRAALREHPARRVLEDPADDLLRRLPGTKREVLSVVTKLVPRAAAAAGARHGPAAAGLDRQHADPRRHQRPRHVTAVLRHLPRAALRGDRARAAGSSSASCCSPPAPSSAITRSAMSGCGSTSGCTRSGRR